MCEYCGCQDITVIAELTAEHDRLRELGRDLETATDRADIATARELVCAMHAVLAPHTAVEEGGLFPAMSEFADGMALLTAEHRLIHDALDAVSAEPPPADWPQRVRDGLHRLFEHILKEQDGVFPAALATLSTADWERVETVRAAAGSVVPTRSGAGR